MWDLYIAEHTAGASEGVLKVKMLIYSIRKSSLESNEKSREKSDEKSSLITTFDSKVCSSRLGVQADPNGKIQFNFVALSEFWFYFLL